VSSIQAVVAAYPPAIPLYDYFADEIGQCTNLVGPVRQWAQNMHQAGVKTLAVMSPTSALLDDGTGTGRSAVDIWTMLPMMFEANPTMVNQAIGKGDEVWSYNSLSQDPYSPKWLIDYAPINFRIQAGFISQSLNLKGLLYWRADRWSSDPWNQVNNEGVFSPDNFPGEGMLLYPGDQVGIAGAAPSIRLKQLRDGIQDFEYIEQLKKTGNDAWALDVAASVGRNFSDWTQDPVALETARDKLGQELHRLSGGDPSLIFPKPPPPTLVSLVLSPSVMTGGQTSSQNIITLSNPAPADGAVVLLYGDSATAATVPPSITIPSGATSATFPIQTVPVTGEHWINISAVYQGVIKSVTLTTDPVPTTVKTSLSLQLSTNTVKGGQNTTGNMVLLSAPAGAGGATIALYSGVPSVATVPQSITVPAGSLSGAFSIQTNPVAGINWVNIVAVYGDTVQSLRLDVVP
jgi:hypothetical protein